MLLEGFNHAAILTGDTERFVTFYRDVFDAEVAGAMEMNGEGLLTFVQIGQQAEINLFEVRDNREAERQAPMFGRGRIDHLGLQAASLPAFEEIRRRLIEKGAADEFVTDFGPVLSLFFRTLTDWREKSAWPTPKPNQGSSIHPALLPSATCTADRRCR